MGNGGRHQACSSGTQGQEAEGRGEKRGRENKRIREEKEKSPYHLFRAFSSRLKAWVTRCRTITYSGVNSLIIIQYSLTIEIMLQHWSKDKVSL